MLLGFLAALSVSSLLSQEPPESFVLHETYRTAVVPADRILRLLSGKSAGSAKLCDRISRLEIPVSDLIPLAVRSARFEVYLGDQAVRIDSPSPAGGQRQLYDFRAGTAYTVYPQEKKYTVLSLERLAAMRRGVQQYLQQPAKETAAIEALPAGETRIIRGQQAELFRLGDDGTAARYVWLAAAQDAYAATRTERLAPLWRFQDAHGLDGDLQAAFGRRRPLLRFECGEGEGGRPAIQITELLKFEELAQSDSIFALPAGYAEASLLEIFQLGTGRARP